jgi:L,D-transpeptidase catalytic domain
MLSPLGRITLMAIGVGLTVILVSGTIVLIAPRASPVDRVAVARPEERIRYPANAYPRLSLPGGQKQTVKSVLNVRHKMEFGSFVWNEEGIPPGEVWVRIDLARQMLSVFRAGHEIGSAVILYGTDGKPTPTGAFTVLAKDETYYSRTYDAPMPFMLRLTEDGVAIHASNVRAGSATHGCIGVPGDFARRLFAQAQAGDAVVILPPAV